jgi:hypothetical protein
MQGGPNMSHDTSHDIERISIDDLSQQALGRFFLRAALIILLALCVMEEFWASLALLMFVGGFSCSAFALLRNESPASPSLNFWDESVGHYAVFFLMKALGHI